MPPDPKQWDTALLSSSVPEHWPEFANTTTTLRQELNNIVDPDDKIRILAYRLWMDFYRNRPENFKIMLRCDDEDDAVEIYLPSAAKIIESTHRFLCVGMELAPLDDVGTGNDQKAVTAQIEKLFKRERFEAKFASQKRHCLIKGDACWHIVGDFSKRKGRRLSLKELPPDNYFPIIDYATDERTGCHIVDVIKNPKQTPAQRNSRDEYLARRQTYRKERNKKGEATGRITSELSLFELGKWDDRHPDNEVVLVENLQFFALPTAITQLPVYHFRNKPPQNSPFGVSEIAGIELLLKALNQSISDEDLTLITQGLGVYYTDSPPPVDAEGNTVPYEIGPGSVVQTGPDGNFGRATGVSSVAPYQDHMKFGDDYAMQGSGVPDIAAGQVADVQVAESGIARILKMGPLIAKNAEKELEILDVHNQMAYDLVHMWLPAYEAQPTYLAGDPTTGEETELIEVEFTVEDPMPRDRKADFEELQAIWETGVMPVDKYYAHLNDDFGYDFEDGDFEQAVADQTLLAQAQTGGGFDGATGNGEVDAEGNPIDPNDPGAQQNPDMPMTDQLPTGDLVKLLNGNSGA